MKDLTKLTIKELYKEMGELHHQLEIELSMDGSGELGGKIMEDFEPLFDRIEDEIKSRSEEELEAYIDENAPEDAVFPDFEPWDKDEIDPAGGRGLASHI
jgi:hypothetical protein